MNDDELDLFTIAMTRPFVDDGTMRLRLERAALRFARRALDQDGYQGEYLRATSALRRLEAVATYKIIEHLNSKDRP